MRKTSNAEFVQWMPFILDALREHGGSATPREVYDTAASRAARTVIRNGATLEFTYTRSNTALAHGCTFAVSSVGVSEVPPSDDGTVQTVKATLPAGSAGRRFVRLEVTAP